MRSVDVVLPASMCAIIPMLRVSSSLNARLIVPGTALFSPVRVATASVTSTSPLPQTTTCKLLKPARLECSCAAPLRGKFLPAVMGEGFVGFGHAVDVFLLLDGTAAGICRVDQFIRKLVDHGAPGAFARILQEPANGQRLAAERIHFHRYLIVGATDATRLDFQQRLGVFQRLLENLEGVVVGLFGDLIHGAVEHALRGALLAFPHHRADELLDEIAGIDWIDCLNPPAD